MGLKKSIAASMSAVGFLLAPPAFGDGIVVGKVEYIRVHDGDLIPGWGPPVFWFSLVGVANLGSCPGWAGGKTLFLSKSKESLAVVLSAQLTGREVAVYYSDQGLMNGVCRVAYITTGDPPPHF